MLRSKRNMHDLGMDGSWMGSQFAVQVGQGEQPFDLFVEGMHVCESVASVGYLFEALEFVDLAHALLDILLDHVGKGHEVLRNQLFKVDPGLFFG